MDKIVGGHYRLRRKLGAGSFGEIYSAENTRTHRRVAIKMESSKSKVPQLAYESKLYAIFSGGTGIPRLHWYGTEGSHNMMVIDLLGKSLEDLFVQCHHRFSLKTVLMLADQMISCVEFIHNKNFIHRDIKPDNFAMGLGSTSNQVFIIDYGLSKKYRDQHSHNHIPYIEGKSLTGTARYASVGALRGTEQSRRDDLESLGFVWLYLLRGNLPWMGLNGRNQKQKYDRICEVKAKTSFVDLCKGFPIEFVKYFNAVRALKFTERPNYSELKQMFRDLFIRLGYVYDYKYDWTSSTPTSSSHSKPTIQSIYSGNRKGSIVNNNSMSRQNSTLVKIHSIPMLLENSKNGEIQNSKKNEKESDEKMVIQQSCFTGNKNKTQYSENNNENNSFVEKDVRPNINSNIYKRNKISQSQLTGSTRRERVHQHAEKDDKGQLDLYNRMNNLNSTEIRNSNIRHERSTAQRMSSASRTRNQSTNQESARRRVSSGTRTASTRKNPNSGTKENSARRLLMDYWLEESRNRRVPSGKRVYQ